MAERCSAPADWRVQGARQRSTGSPYRSSCVVVGGGRSSKRCTLSPPGEPLALSAVDDPLRLAALAVQDCDSDTPMMRPNVALTGLLLLVLAFGCSTSDKEPERTLPTVKPSSVPTAEPVTPSPTHAPTCGAFRSGKVSKIGGGFIAELNVMSGLPNPAWRLSKAEGIELRKLLQTTRRGIDTDGPDELGGYGVTADRGAVGFLRGLELPERFWVQGDNKIAKLLGGTVPCTAPVS